MTGVDMRAVSVWNPWATLLAHGFKKNETRGYPAPASLLGESIAICSTKTVKADQRNAWGEVPPAIKFEALAAGLIKPASLMQGHLLGFATVADCVETTPAFIEGLTARERALGWYGPGRYAWLMSAFLPLSSPIPVRGAQGIWRLPDDVYAQAQGQLEARAREARPA